MTRNELIASIMLEAADLLREDSINEAVVNTDPDDRENVLNMTLKILEDNNINPEITDKAKNDWIDCKEESLCLFGVDKNMCTKVNKEIKSYGGKLSPDNYNTSFLSLNETTLSLNESGKVLSGAQRFLSGIGGYLKRKNEELAKRRGIELRDTAPKKQEYKQPVNEEYEKCVQTYISKISGDEVTIKCVEQLRAMMIRDLKKLVALFKKDEEINNKIKEDLNNLDYDYEYDGLHVNDQGDYTEIIEADQGVAIELSWVIWTLQDILEKKYAEALKEFPMYIDTGDGDEGCIYIIPYDKKNSKKN